MVDGTFRPSDLDAVLGRTLANASRAGLPPSSVILAVLARSRSAELPSGQVKVFLRSRGDAVIRDLVSDRFGWKTLTTAAEKYGESVTARGNRIAIARRAVAALLRPLPAGESALVAAFALAMLEDPTGWDSAQITKRLDVQLGCGHTTIASRVRKLEDAKVLTLLTRQRGVPSRVKFRRVNKAADELFDAYPTARSLVSALAATEGTVTPSDSAGAVAIFRSITAPAIGYGALGDDAWYYMLLRCLGAEKLLSPGRIARSRRALRSALVDPDEPSLFADAVTELSEGEATVLRDAAEAARSAAATERAASAARARLVRESLYEKTLPALYGKAGDPPKAPTSKKTQEAARVWLASMTALCAPALAKPELATALRVELRRALIRRGWNAEHVKRSVSLMLPTQGDGHFSETKEVAA